MHCEITKNKPNEKVQQTGNHNYRTRNKRSETKEALLSFSQIHDEESDGTSPMSLERQDIWK